MKPQPHDRRRLFAIAAAVASVAAYVEPADGVIINTSWIGSNSGVYNNPANWSGGAVPNNGGGNYYNVTIGRPLGAVVGGNMPATILNLNIHVGNYFIPQSENEFTLIGTPTNGATTINNNGTLSVTAAIPYSRLTLAGSTTNLTGAGTVLITNGVIGGNSILTTSNYITGRGSFGNNTLGIINNGTIVGGDPQFENQSLAINPGTGGVINNGTMQSAHNGVLSLYDGVFNNVNGTIRAGTGTVLISQSTVAGGQISAAAGATVSINSSTLHGTTLATSGSGIVRAVLNDSTFNQISNTGNLALTNGARVTFTETNHNSGTIHVVHSSGSGNATLAFSSDSTAITGNGTIVLNSNAGSIARIAGTGTFVNTANRIVGSGSFIGGSIQNGGLIRADGSGMFFQSNGLNYGTMNVQGGAQLTINSGSWSNLGIIAVGQNGTLTLLSSGGPSTFFSSGTLNISPSGTLSTSTARTLDTTGGSLWLALASTAHINGPLMAGSIQLHGTMHQSGPMSAGAVAGFGTLNLAAPSTAAVVDHLRIGTLISNGTLTIRPSGTETGVSRLTAGAPQLLGQGKLDLNDNALVIDYSSASPLATVAQQLAAGHAAGAWDGPGIISSAAAQSSNFALGYAESSAVFTSFPAMFMGQSVDSTTVLVRYTRQGDANLDGVVNLADFNRLAASFGSTSATWSQGDFNYDGLVNLADFNRLAGNFGLGASGPEVTPEDWSALASAVPEPASIAWLTAGALAARRTRGGNCRLRSVQRLRVHDPYPRRGS